VKWRALISGCALALAGVVPADCHAATTPASNLADASIEDLMNIQVTSVSKKEESLSKVGAAVFVLGSEDIRRSGATNIPDLLRLVPGMDVAQIDGHTWAITIRGFNGTYANKVLVLIDGRSVYSPLTSGVNWDQQDVPLEDIYRIEVIRGPGGTIWGANAVNGVINIITKQADATKGGLLVLGGGSHDAARDVAQYGGNIGSTGAYRVFGSYSDTMGSTLPQGAEAADSWHMLHFGARSDWTLSPHDNLTVQGDAAQLSSSQGFQTASNELGSQAANVLGRWTRSFDTGSNITLQVYFDHYNRVEKSLLGEFRNTFDLDFHQDLKLGSRHDLIWGLGYRVTGDRVDGSTGFFYSPSRRLDNLGSAFVQDEITLTRSLSLTVGTKIEHNDYTGFELEPSAQLVWMPDKRQQVWASIARAVRQPNRADAGLDVTLANFPLQGGGFGVIEAFGQPNQKSESLRDFELGYRVDPNRRLSLDFASFFGVWRNLSQAVPADPYFTFVGAPHLVVPLIFQDEAHGRSYGGEVFATWKISNRWRVVPGFSFSHVEITQGGQSVNGTGNSGGTTPRVGFQIRSLVNLTRSIEWDNTLSYTGALGDFGGGPVPAYTRFDMRLGRRVGEWTEISVAGQNLFNRQHIEFPDDQGLSHTLVQRTVFGRIAFRF
jgi:iron complex outermembrane recepter protein